MISTFMQPLILHMRFLFIYLFFVYFYNYISYNIYFYRLIILAIRQNMTHLLKCWHGVGIY